MRKDFHFHYDGEADVLYLSVGKPQRAKTVEMAEDFILRLHPKTAKVVGMTIIDFSKHFPELKPAHFKTPLNGSFDPVQVLAQAMSHHTG